MTQQQANELNNQISYQSGKLYYDPNKGWTTETMQYLFKCGYTASNSGAMHYLEDADGSIIASAHSWIDLLFQTSKIMA